MDENQKNRSVRRSTRKTDFLDDFTRRNWDITTSECVRTCGLFLGNGLNAIEIAVAISDKSPKKNLMLKIWRERQAGRATPVLLVVQSPHGTALCGPSGVNPPIYFGLETTLVEKLCCEVLIQPNMHSARRFLEQALPSLDSQLPGLNNRGLLATHQLVCDVPNRTDWLSAQHKSKQIIGFRNKELLIGLGFNIEPLDNLTSLLRSNRFRSALAILLFENESPELGNSRFHSLSPISYAFKKADDEGLAWIVIVQGSRIRLYSTSMEAGVGRRGRTETFVECQCSLLEPEQISYLWLIFSAYALKRDGSLNQILDESKRFAGDLANRLRERIYDNVVPKLAKGLAKVNGIKNPSPEELSLVYEMALVVLFRLLFIAYAEDRDLLPYRTNHAYQRRSLKQKALELAEYIAKETPIAKGDNHWTDTSQLWKAIAYGNEEWNVPAYDGGLFSEDPKVSVSGARIAEVSLPNKYFESALRFLLVINTSEGEPGPVDFRSLGVREFGTIYEGLLESELALAECNLTLTRDGTYIPTDADRKISIQKGEIYLHNRSGARKSTGSYYTKPFAVTYLLDTTLTPALDNHYFRLCQMTKAEATKKFFDFRVADIAMGSGHFLISAIDYIEKRMADWLTESKFSDVRRELDALRIAATANISGGGGGILY